ncbi:hypothetical protein [Streptomyces sp. NPDC051000]|uniref:hypothetical protein n=1 Tax=unclassified Streptomyces TaxID=2593676 RepID=UPI0033F84DA9
MFSLTLAPQAHGTLVDTLRQLVDASGLVITLRSPEGLEATVGAIVEVAPRLSEDHDIKGNGLIVSRVGMYRVVWGVVRCPGGSLAVLAPLPEEDRSEYDGWARHFRIETLDPIGTLAERGYGVNGGGNGTVLDGEFARAFSHASV